MLRHTAVAALLALPLVAFAQPQDQLVRDYTRFAGSEANAESLVTGLRNDEPIKLASKDGTTTTTFKPATEKLGYGNVKIALALARESLAEQGIYKPTPEQIEAALNGGTVTLKSGKEVKLDGVLEMRASGMGWGRIAQEHGFKLGQVMRADARPARADFHPARIERPQRPERPERGHRK
ncbi:MAG TPA: hypothetical protein VIQ55_02210 [Burkholderiales bacterium]|jgi:hypothetical protein